MKEILSGFPVETDNKTIRKAVSEAIEWTRKEGVKKLACLNAARTGFLINKYLDARAKSAIEAPPARSRSEKSADDDSGVITHPGLFRKLKEWRNIKAGEMELPHYMILHQKTMVTLANLIPQSMSALKLVKGMGKKKSEKFGEELLEIISLYCKQLKSKQRK